MLILSLCLHLSSFTLYLLFATMFVINYGLECFTYLVIAYIHHSAHILFVYKLVLVYFDIGGLNIHWCFIRYLNFQLVSEWVHLLWFKYLSVILDPLYLLPWIVLCMLLCVY